MKPPDKYIKTDVEGLVKDPKSKAVLSVDNVRLAAYRRQKRFMRDSTDTTKRLAVVENEISEIKQLLLQLIGKNNE